MTSASTCLPSSTPDDWGQEIPDSLPQMQVGFKGALGQRDSSLGLGHQPGRASGWVLVFAWEEWTVGVMGESRLRPSQEAFGQRLKNRAAV